MKLWQIWALTLITAIAYLVICSDLDARQAKIQRCAVVHCV
jgi:hypothetical protein